MPNLQLIVAVRYIPRSFVTRHQASRDSLVQVDAFPAQVCAGRRRIRAQLIAAGAKHTGNRGRRSCAASTSRPPPSTRTFIALRFLLLELQHGVDAHGHRQARRRQHFHSGTQHSTESWHLEPQRCRPDLSSDEGTLSSTHRPLSLAIILGVPFAHKDLRSFSNATTKRASHRLLYSPSTTMTKESCA